MDLNIKDVSELLNVSETTLLRWLSDGKIPSYRIDNQYRFSRTEIEDWVLRHRVSKEDSFQETASTGGNKQFSLYRALHKGLVLENVPGNTKETLFRNASEEISKQIGVDHEMLLELLLDREKLMPTALNKGIGIPHARDSFVTTHHDVVAIVFPEKPIAYGALDGIPVHTLFFLFACDDKRHLHLLAKIAHLSSKAETHALLHKRPSKEALLEYIKSTES